MFICCSRLIDNADSNYLVKINCPALILMKTFLFLVAKFWIYQLPSSIGPVSFPLNYTQKETGAVVQYLLTIGISQNKAAVVSICFLCFSCGPQIPYVIFKSRQLHTFIVKTHNTDQNNENELLTAINRKT